MKQTNQTDRLSPLEKIGYGLGDFGSNVVFQTIIILLPAFYTDVFGLAPAAMGLLFLLVRLLDTVIDPIMGMIADHTNTRWGKYRPYLLWFSIPFAILFVLTYVTPEFSKDPEANMQAKLFYAYVTYGGLMILYTAVNIPYCALGGVITADSQERVSANSYRFVLATSAGVLITYFGPDLVNFFGKGNQQIGYPWAMSVFAVLLVLSLVMCFALTRERVTQAAPVKGSMKQDVTALLQNDQWLIIAVLFFVLLISIVLRGGSSAFYIKWVAKRPDLTAWFLTSGTVAQMIGASLASPLTRLFDKVPSYIFSQVMIVLGSVGLYFTPADNIQLIFANFILINFFVQMGAPILFTMAADSVEYGELKTGRRVTGLVFSGALFALKLGVAVGGWLIGEVLGRYGYEGKSATQTPQAIFAVLILITILPAIGHLLLIPIASFYKLNKARCQEIRQQLEQSKQQTCEQS